jgi:MFS family permease
LGLFLFAASAPSPLYGVYARLFRFSPTTVTAIYAVYAAGALGALLVTGRLSDHVGRRTVVMVALLIQIGGMIAFIKAGSVGALYLGRVLQGIATGVASGAISAWLVDLEPPERPRLGSAVTGIALLAGLGAGAFCSALLVQYAPSPLRLVFWLLSGVYALAFVVTLALPDVVARSAGALGSLRPKVSVPPVARPQFAATAPSLIAMWALAGLYLSLGPALATTLVRTNNRVFGGLVIICLCGGGAITSALVQRIDPRPLIIRSSIVVVAGVGATLIAVLYNSTPGLYAGSVIAGLGLGPAFSGVVRSLGPLAPPEKRGALFAALYIVVYVAISVPTIAAGVATSRIGLRETTYAYGLAVMVLTAVTVVAVSRRRVPAAA